MYMIAVYVGTNFPTDYFVAYPKDYIHPYLGVHGGGLYGHWMDPMWEGVPYLLRSVRVCPSK